MKILLEVHSPSISFGQVPVSCEQEKAKAQALPPLPGRSPHLGEPTGQQGSHQQAQHAGIWGLPALSFGETGRRFRVLTHRGLFRCAGSLVDSPGKCLVLLEGTTPLFRSKSFPHRISQGLSLHNLDSRSPFPTCASFLYSETFHASSRFPQMACKRLPHFGLPGPGQLPPSFSLLSRSPASFHVTPKRAQPIFQVLSSLFPSLLCKAWPTQPLLREPHFLDPHSLLPPAIKHPLPQLFTYWMWKLK